MDDWGVGIDAFVTATFAGSHVVKTSIVKNLSPVFNTALEIPVWLPVMTRRITLQVWDWDRVGSNELVGTLYFDFEEVCKNRIFLNKKCTPPCLLIGY